MTFEQFRDFILLTGKGIKSVPLENEIIIQEFNLADRYRKGILSKEDLKIFISKLFTAICETISTEFEKYPSYSNLLNQTPFKKFSPLGSSPSLHKSSSSTSLILTDSYYEGLAQSNTSPNFGYSPGNYSTIESNSSSPYYAK